MENPTSVDEKENIGELQQNSDDLGHFESEGSDDLEKPSPREQPVTDLQSNFFFYKLYKLFHLINFFF